MDFNIEIDDLSDGVIAHLLNVHWQQMQKYSPEESIHAIDVKQLQRSTLVFWGARNDGKLAGCGALQQLSPVSGELKSMKTNVEYLRQGVAQQLLTAITDEARSRGYDTLYLETGSHDAFKPAIAMYKKHGFDACSAFGDYQEDPHSRFFKKQLK